MQTRCVRAFILRIAALFGLLCTSSTAAAQPVAGSEAAVAQPDAIAAAFLDAGAQDYARAFGVELAEGRRRAAIGQQAVLLQRQLESEAADNFAGLVIENAPQFRVVVRFKADPAGSIAPSRRV